MVRLLVGAVLMPSAILVAWIGASAIGGLATRQGHAAWTFLFGAAGAALAWVVERYALEADTGPVSWAAKLSRRGYVLGHELTHALAAWSVGGVVFGFSVREDGGHVDLYQSSGYIALAPYCVPIYSLTVVLGYRLLLWARPGTGGRTVFLALMGATIGFHVTKTIETLWDRKQPDLPAAGGVVFSLAWILLFNGLTILLLVKALFPAAVDLSESAGLVVLRTKVFWRSVYDLLKPLTRTFAAQLRRS